MRILPVNNNQKQNQSFEGRIKVEKVREDAAQFVKSYVAETIRRASDELDAIRTNDKEGNTIIEFDPSVVENAKKVHERMKNMFANFSLDITTLEE